MTEFLWLPFRLSPTLIEILNELLLSLCRRQNCFTPCLPGHLLSLHLTCCCVEPQHSTGFLSGVWADFFVETRKMQNYFCLLRYRSIYTRDFLSTRITSRLHDYFSQFPYQESCPGKKTLCGPSVKRAFGWKISADVWQSQAVICKHSLYTGKCQASLQLLVPPPLHFI